MARCALPESDIYQINVTPNTTSLRDAVMVLGGLDGGLLVQARAASKPARWSLAGYSLACQDADSRPASDTAIRSISAKMTRAFRSSTETSAARPASNLAERSANRRALSASRTPARATPALARAPHSNRKCRNRHQGIEKRVTHGRNLPPCCHGRKLRPKTRMNQRDATGSVDSRKRSHYGTPSGMPTQISRF